MTSVRRVEVRALLTERFGWTAQQVDEMPDATLAWLLDHLAD